MYRVVGSRVPDSMLDITLFPFPCAHVFVCMCVSICLVSAVESTSLIRAPLGYTRVIWPL